MFGKKPDKPVKFTEDKNAAKDRRGKALTDAQRKGLEVKETKKGVERVVPKTAKGKKEQANRETINKLSRQAEDQNRSPIYPATKKGSRSEWS